MLTIKQHLARVDIDRAAGEAVDRLNEDPGPGSTIAMEFAFEIGGDVEPDELDPRKPEHAVEFQAFVASRAREGVLGAIHGLGRKIEASACGRVEVWREIVVRPDWALGEAFSRPLGTCWAHRAEAAEAHWGQRRAGHVRVVLQGLVDPADVDWAETVVLDAVARDTVGEESEVRLLPAARVEIVGVHERSGHGSDLREHGGHDMLGAILAAGDADPGDADESHYVAIHEEARGRTGHFGEAGAGCVVIARSTGRVLMPLRSDEVDEPGTWGTWGGAIDPGLDPRAAALRELRQESGFSGACVLVPLLIYAPEGTSFRYRNYLAVVDDEFDPALDWETARAEWVALDEMPSPLHFGLAALLADDASMARIREVADAVPACGVAPR